MKQLFLLALALVMTCTFAFAQSQTPYAKGKYYGKQIITLTFQEDEAGMERLGENLEKYIVDNINSEEDIVNFFEGLEAGLRDGCKANGFSDEETDQIVEMMGYAILEGMLGEMY